MKKVNENGEWVVEREGYSSVNHMRKHFMYFVGTLVVIVAVVVIVLINKGA